MSETASSSAEIDDWLARPRHRISLSELSQSLDVAELRLFVETTDIGVEDHLLLNALRGALGDQLLTVASMASRAGASCTWQPPCALDLLYRSRQIGNSGLSVPTPFVLELERTGEGLCIIVRLFGLSVDWMPGVADACTRMLQQPIHPRGHGEVEFHLDRRVVTEAVFPMPDDVDQFSGVVLELVTPLDYRAKAGKVINPVSILTGLLNRVTGMARWQGLDVVADVQALKSQAVALSCDMNAIEPMTYRRWSGRQARWIEGNAIRGTIAFQGELDTWADVIAVGALLHAGRRASAGYGRYRPAFVY